MSVVHMASVNVINNTADRKLITQPVTGSFENICHLLCASVAVLDKHSVSNRTNCKLIQLRRVEFLAVRVNNIVVY